MKFLNKEEFDVLKVLHSPIFAGLNPFFLPRSIYTTYVLQYYPKLCNRIVFRIGTYSQVRDRRGTYFEIFCPEHAESLLGFHKFLGCDYIGRFQGKLKESCAKLFFKDGSEALVAFKILGSEPKGDYVGRFKGNDAGQYSPNKYIIRK